MSHLRVGGPDSAERSENRLYTHLYQIPEFSFSLGLRLLPQAVDVLFLVFFTALLTVTICTIRTRIADTKGTP